MAFAGVRTTPVKTVPKSNYSLSCRLCEVSVVSNGGYYSLISENSQKLKIFERIWALFAIEDDNLSVGPHVLCKKCFRRIERYEATVKELTSLKVKYQENVARWRSDVTRTKRCSSSPGDGIKKSRSSSVDCDTSERKNVRRSLNIQPANNDANDSMDICTNPGNVEVGMLHF